MVQVHSFALAWNISLANTKWSVSAMNAVLSIYRQSSTLLTMSTPDCTAHSLTWHPVRRWERKDIVMYVDICNSCCCFYNQQFFLLPTQDLTTYVLPPQTLGFQKASPEFSYGARSLWLDNGFSGTEFLVLQPLPSELCDLLDAEPLVRRVTRHLIRRYLLSVYSPWTLQWHHGGHLLVASQRGCCRRKSEQEKARYSNRAPSIEKEWLSTFNAHLEFILFVLTSFVIMNENVFFFFSYEAVFMEILQTNYRNSCGLSLGEHKKGMIIWYN